MPNNRKSCRNAKRRNPIIADCGAGRSVYAKIRRLIGSLHLSSSL